MIVECGGSSGRILLSSIAINFDASRLSFSSNENAVASVSKISILGGSSIDAIQA